MAWVGADFDGTLVTIPPGGAYYDGGGYTDPCRPVEVMVARVKEWLAEGREVRIVTARVSSYHPLYIRERQQQIIREWCELYLGQPLKVTSEKDPEMVCLYDDRAVAVERNTGRILGGHE